MAIVYILAIGMNWIIMTARDGVATDLAPLRFTDRVAAKSSALPAVELIPEWDKAME